MLRFRQYRGAFHGGSDGGIRRKSLNTECAEEVQSATEAARKMPDSLPPCGCGLLFEVFEGAVVRASQFLKVPVRLQLEVQLGVPRFDESFGVLYIDIYDHVVAVDAVEPLDNVQLVAV